ncbi:MAG: TlyA family RNA methyltransferase [Sneathiellales bacterium]|nr:TlyA family RNA methyltransferase [Sneathiellales bacterium]
MSEGRNRLDLELVARKLVQSRAKAQALVQEGSVLVDGAIVTKTSTKVTGVSDIQVTNCGPNRVGRGAYKLLAALEYFKPDLKGATAADIGASTGGFSQILLEWGATKIYAVDVGHGQLHPSLKEDPRIFNMEGVNARYLNREQIPDLLNVVVTDASFISLKKLLPASLELCAPGAYLFALIKPQFEVGKGNLGKGGVIRDPDQAEQVRKDLEHWVANQPGWISLGTIDSPIKGSDGNHEYLIGAQKNA